MASFAYFEGHCTTLRFTFLALQALDILPLPLPLSDQTRLVCVLLIHQQQELCVCELMVALEESQPKVSRHLEVSFALHRCNFLDDQPIE